MNHPNMRKNPNACFGLDGAVRGGGVRRENVVSFSLSLSLCLSFCCRWMKKARGTWRVEVGL